jgi:transposase
VEGATIAVVFEAYVELALAPSLCPGQVVVMDNLGAHRPKRVRDLIEGRSCELVYLPAYSPDYKQIEEAFAKIKNLLRKTAARTKRGIGRGDRGSPLCDQCPRRPGLLRACRIPPYGSPTVKRAVKTACWVPVVRVGEADLSSPGLTPSRPNRLLGDASVRDSSTQPS